MSLGVDRLRSARSDPTGALVLLHGRGADEHDLIPLLEVLDPDQHLVGILPRAPQGLAEGGYAWYDAERVGEPESASFREALEMTSAWVGGLESRTGVPLARTAVVGFSQGGVMAYALGLAGSRDRFASIVALSTYLPHVADVPLDLEADGGPPVTIAHGRLDPVVDVGFGRAARDQLLAGGLDVVYRETAVEHTIDPAWLPLLRERLAAGFAGAP